MLRFPWNLGGGYFRPPPPSYETFGKRKAYQGVDNIHELLLGTFLKGTRSAKWLALAFESSFSHYLSQLLQDLSLLSFPCCLS